MVIMLIFIIRVVKFGVRVLHHANEENTGVDRIDDLTTKESPSEIIANERV